MTHTQCYLNIYNKDIQIYIFFIYFTHLLLNAIQKDIRYGYDLFYS